MNTELQLTVYQTDGKSAWTVLVIAISGRHVCKHWGISAVLSCILLLQ